MTMTLQLIKLESDQPAECWVQDWDDWSSPKKEIYMNGETTLKGVVNYLKQHRPDISFGLSDPTVLCPPEMLEQTKQEDTELGLDWVIGVQKPMDANQLLGLELQAMKMTKDEALQHYEESVGEIADVLNEAIMQLCGEEATWENYVGSDYCPKKFINSNIGKSPLDKLWAAREAANSVIAWVGMHCDFERSEKEN